MGILNLTPDSFYIQNDYKNKTILQRNIDLLKYSDIIDVGAESSRPGAIKISLKEELKRLKILEDINLNNSFLSIDSYKPKVIEYSLNNGFKMINDISGGGLNFENIDLAYEYNVPIIIMHMLGKPSYMQKKPKYNNIIDDIKSFFEERINYAVKIGCRKNQIILDPGIGFGKTIDDNDNIILNLKVFKDIGYPLLIGLSRKSFLAIDSDMPLDRLPQSLGVLALAINNGINIARTHDVLDTLKMIKIIDRISRNN